MKTDEKNSKGQKELLIATENNGIRSMVFQTTDGTPSEHVAYSMKLRTDMSTPIAVGGTPPVALYLMSIIANLRGAARESGALWRDEEEHAGGGVSQPEEDDPGTDVAQHVVGGRQIRVRLALDDHEHDRRDDRGDAR